MTIGHPFLMWVAFSEVTIMNRKNDQDNKFLPIWVWIIALIQIFLVLFFSVGTFMNPGDFIPEVSELNYVTQLYITRNVMVALVPRNT